MKITKKLYLHWQPDENSKDGGSLEVFGFDASYMEHAVYLLLKEVDIEFDFPPFDPRELLVSKLRAERERIIADATKRAEQIEEKIQQLLALPASA